MPNIVEPSDGLEAVVLDDNGNIIGLMGPGRRISVQPISADVTASFTATKSHANLLIPCNSASAINITIPPDSTEYFPPGATFAVFQKGAGAVAFVAGSGVTIRTPLSLSARTQYSTIAIVKLSDNLWLVSGDLL